MNDWTKTLIKPEASLSEAIQVINLGALRIAIVVDGERRLLGTITDGDVRRALILQNGMDTPVAEIMSRKPITASIYNDRKSILLMMKASDVLQVPVVDENRCVVGLETLQQLLEPCRLDNLVFLMAGGFGKRLRPLTDDIPKPLLKVGHKPILETILKQIIESGFYNFSISTHYKAEQVKDYFGDGSKWGVNISYVHESEPLGTAGALGLLPRDALQQPLLMMNGDLLTKIDFQQLLQFHNEQNCAATMCVREYDFQVPYGVVEQNNNIIKGIIEKPIHKFFVNAGIYILDPDVVASVQPNQSIDMPTLLENQIEGGKKIAAFPIHEYWIDIGRMEEYERANRDVDDE